MILYVRAAISLSILAYEEEMRKQVGSIARSRPFYAIKELVEWGGLHSLHLDVMRPSLIRNRTVFSIELIHELHQHFGKTINMDIHLMTKEPILLMKEISNFIEPHSRPNISATTQLEAFHAADEAIEALRNLRSMGYKAGIGLDLQTDIRRLTPEIADNADMILIMCVPMGKGGQKYDEQSTDKIVYVSRSYAGKTIEVDGGIDKENAVKAIRAGARVLVIGSYITGNKKPLGALQEVAKLLESSWPGE